ncbi:hypothetical protein TNCT_617141 [Trichonephila clavata]|uniref:Uncharacterized protein n=1 Tax=Trichonephila clavata TaxID=2740835 RepID=A0A8X6KWA0_TRICU|nr:hypothetical protein TNCT_617141 [Trichonephila clavata]
MDKVKTGGNLIPSAANHALMPQAHEARAGIPIVNAEVEVGQLAAVKHTRVCESRCKYHLLHVHVDSASTT